MLFRIKIVTPAQFRPVDPRAAGAAERFWGCSVTAVDQPAEPDGAIAAPRSYRKGSLLADWLSSTDHKIIGHLYLITSFGFFLIGGLMAHDHPDPAVRAEQLSIVSDQQYNELFTMHGTIMLLLFATPLFVGFANEIMPLQIGAPDVAFPRLNLLSYYMFAVRRPDPAAQLPDPGRRGGVRLVRLLAADQRARTRPASAATCGSWA